MEWEPVIGLEIHVQLATQSKIFSGALTRYGAPPNSQACAIDLGMPGVLPVLNEQAVRMAVKLGLAIDAKIAPLSVMSRKHYFYPDLPKGYQISQYDQPIVHDGHLFIDVEGDRKRIGITRAHLEEDAGKSVHEGFERMTGIDLNRAGTPLLEVVSEPDMRSAAEAVAYMKALHALVQYLEICDGNLQEGSFRCDANVSIRPRGEKRFGTRAELKNLNSFRFVEKAIIYEIERQAEVLESGGTVMQETRLFDSVKGETRSMRGKEEAHDYRYFPEPDLLPIEVTAELVESVRGQMPELPEAKRARFVDDYGLSGYDAGVLTASRAVADYYETVVQEEVDPKLAANWVMGELSAALNRGALAISDSPVDAVALAGLLGRIADHTLSQRVAKEVFEAMWAGEGDADAIVEARGLKQITGSDALAPIVDKVIADNPDQLAQYRAGKDKLLGYFVGQVMKATGGKANPQQVNELLRKKLSDDS